MPNVTRSSAALVALILGLASQASAHVTLALPEAPAGSPYMATFRVPHGCEGAATDTLRVTLPEGFYAAKPMPKAGWSLEIVSGAYEESFSNHGTEMTEGPRQIVWSGGQLEDAWYDEFTVRGTIGPSVEPGTVLSFEAVQTCGDAVEEWTGEMAPSVTVTPATAGDGHGDHAEAAGEWQAGDLTLTGAFSRATLPNAPVGGGFLTIANDGAEDDRLVAAASPVAGRTEIHEMLMDGDVMRMRELEDGLPIPAGESVSLEPGGIHLMLMELGDPLVEGTQVPMTLTFQQAGEVEILLDVGAINARTAGGDMDHSGMDHGDMDHAHSDEEATE
ncbi:copper chaperone PCu(A)C [Pseudoroseicyclus tamaricis]|uniref:Copper chaperone PCu(A)C n=1 Tax=Pseudoroseicyclus tamaricis TaxID=2705421 RepID=A0A6B2JZQ5_9RHOB|nr:copper chaperone PCu(A)C [Pseudoroseicyclus tamaricis]NDV00852.1 copper chaperone PCu(A)C [Pseudoroseicyclus tamaricis]